MTRLKNLFKSILRLVGGKSVKEEYQHIRQWLGEESYEKFIIAMAAHALSGNNVDVVDSYYQVFVAGMQRGEQIGLINASNIYERRAQEERKRMAAFFGRQHNENNNDSSKQETRDSQADSGL